MAEGTTGSRFSRFAREALRSMHPAYFALVMATGIVSLACRLLGLPGAARVLYWINLPAYALVWLATIARACFFWRELRADVASHARGPGFFTVVAATDVVGAQVVLFGESPAAGRVMWWVAAVLWVLSTYTIFVALAVREEKPSLAAGINGGWLLAVVATHSLPVLGCLAGPDLFGDREVSLFVLVSFWLAGGMLYIWLISLIFYRYMFFRFEPLDLMPPYWINMGAVAIATLAGSLLVEASANSPLMAPLIPFVKGLTALFWATATWWIPMLLVLGVWRYHYRGVRLRYDPLYWGLVFPLGMYAASTLRLSEVLALPFLIPLARAFVVGALVAWLATSFGLAGRAVDAVLLAVRPPEVSDEPRARRGSALGVIGIAITTLAVVAYCGASFTSGPPHDVVERLVAGPTLSIAIGLGVALWLVGSVLRRTGARD